VFVEACVQQWNRRQQLTKGFGRLAMANFVSLSIVTSKIDHCHRNFDL
jgi:hypothetical protein